MSTRIERASVPALAGCARRGEVAVGGLTPLSATDFPGYLAAVVFCQGCPWRCGYCHNPHLLERRTPATLAWADVRAFLARRIGLLDAVVFSGGEPLAQPGLRAAVESVRGMGFAVGLHTGGAYPRRLAAVLPLVDWVGFDVKADFDAYADVTRVPGSGARACESLAMVIASGVACEVRTTVHARAHVADDLVMLADRLAALGVRRYALQAFRPGRCADDAWNTSAPSLDPALCAAIAERFEHFEVRAA